MKITVNITKDQYDDINEKYKGEFNISFEEETVFINGVEVISENDINRIGYFLSYSVSTESKNEKDYPDRVIISLGDERKLKPYEVNYWALQFGNTATYSFKEILMKF